MSLNNEDRKSLIDYRYEKADLALEDAAFLADAGKYGLVPIVCIMPCTMPLLHF